LIEGEPSFFLFSFFSFCFVAYGCRWVPSPSFGKRGACSPFFSFFLGAFTRFG
jgi:hypothetical protein